MTQRGLSRVALLSGSTVGGEIRGGMSQAFAQEGAVPITFEVSAPSDTVPGVAAG